MVDVPYDTFKHRVCLGDLMLGTGCGTCEKCRWQRAQVEHMGVHGPLQPRPVERMVGDVLTIRRVANGWVLVPGNAGSSVLTHVASSVEELALGVRMWATDQVALTRTPARGGDWEIKG